MRCSIATQLPQPCLFRKNYSFEIIKSNYYYFLTGTFLLSLAATASRANSYQETRNNIRVRKSFFIFFTSRSRCASHSAQTASFAIRTLNIKCQKIFNNDIKNQSNKYHVCCTTSIMCITDKLTLNNLIIE